MTPEQLLLGLFVVTLAVMLKGFRDRWVPDNWRHELANQVIGWAVLGTLTIILGLLWAFGWSKLPVTEKEAIQAVSVPPPAVPPEPKTEEVKPAPTPAPKAQLEREPTPPSDPAPEANVGSLLLSIRDCDVFAGLIREGRALDERCRTTRCENEEEIVAWTTRASQLVKAFPMATQIAFESNHPQPWALAGFPATGSKLLTLHNVNWRWQYLLRLLGNSNCG